jgi:hypothetical protein
MSTRQPAAGLPGLRQRPIATAFLVSVLTCLLAGLHLFFYSRLIGLVLYRLAGGIHLLESGWTRYGGAPFAWTIPLELPGTFLLASSPPLTPNIAGMAGVILVIVASLATAYSFASILGGLIRGKGFCWRRFGWKGLVIALGMIWIPVPEQWALVYYYTVKY